MEQEGFRGRGTGQVQGRYDSRPQTEDSRPQAIARESTGHPQQRREASRRQEVIDWEERGGPELEKAARMEADRKLAWEQEQDQLQSQYAARQRGKEQAGKGQQVQQELGTSVSDNWAANADAREQQRQLQRRQVGSNTGGPRSVQEGQGETDQCIAERAERNRKIRVGEEDRALRVSQVNSKGQKKKRTMGGQNEEHQEKKKEKVSNKEPD